MNAAEPNYALILTVGLACIVAVSIAAIVLLQLRPRFNLRNAFSAACVIAFLLLIALWVRSASHHFDVVTGKLPGNRGFLLNSLYGKIEVEITDRRFAPTLTWHQESQILKLLDGWHFSSPENPAGFEWKKTRSGIRASIPHWSLLIVTIVLAAAPWIRQRFRVRTLFIGMALVAVALGLFVYFSAKPPAAPPIDHVDVPEF